MTRFIEGQDRQQITLMPDCLDGFIADDNPVRVIDAFVGELELVSLGFEGAAGGHGKATRSAAMTGSSLRSMLNLQSCCCNFDANTPSAFRRNLTPRSAGSWECLNLRTAIGTRVRPRHVSELSAGTHVARQREARTCSVGRKP